MALDDKFLEVLKDYPYKVLDITINDAKIRILGVIHVDEFFIKYSSVFESAIAQSDAVVSEGNFMHEFFYGIFRIANNQKRDVYNIDPGQFMRSNVLPEEYREASIAEGTIQLVKLKPELKKLVLIHGAYHTRGIAKYLTYPKEREIELGMPTKRAFYPLLFFENFSIKRWVFEKEWKLVEEIPY